MKPIPYMASGQWYSGWLEALLNDGPDNVAREVAARELNIRTKGWCRAVIETSAGGEELLSVPIIGGNSMVKSNRVEEFRVSDHGDWMRKHIGALEAAYGRTPYYRFFASDLEEIIRNAPGKTLIEVSENIHTLVCRILTLPGTLEALRQARQENPERLILIREDLRRNHPPLSNSLIGTLATLGPETLLML